MVRFFKLSLLYLLLNQQIIAADTDAKPIATDAVVEYSLPAGIEHAGPNAIYTLVLLDVAGHRLYEKNITYEDSNDLMAGKSDLIHTIDVINTSKVRMFRSGKILM